MCVSIYYCYVNIRRKFIQISSRWRNIFQSGFIYHSRRRQSNMMTLLKGASEQTERKGDEGKCNKSAHQKMSKFPHHSTHTFCVFVPLIHEIYFVLG